MVRVCIIMKNNFELSDFRDKFVLKSLFKNKCLFQADEFLGKFHLSRRSIVGYVTETKMEFHKNTSEMR